MQTTIDGAGRVVVPKAVRDEVGLRAGQVIEVIARDGHIEIAPATVAMQLVQRDGVMVAEVDEHVAADVPLLSAEQVRDTLERTRR
jgi:AbrB family looped-hinge helix DNA binding protein